jgi:hypothetical protein
MVAQEAVSLAMCLPQKQGEFSLLITLSASLFETKVSSCLAAAFGVRRLVFKLVRQMGKLT